MFRYNRNIIFHSHRTEPSSFLNDDDAHFCFSRLSSFAATATITADFIFSPICVKSAEEKISIAELFHTKQKKECSEVFSLREISISTVRARRGKV
jgi:hypothetical protein